MKDKVIEFFKEKGLDVSYDEIYSFHDTIGVKIRHQAGYHKGEDQVNMKTIRGFEDAFNCEFRSVNSYTDSEGMVKGIVMFFDVGAMELIS